MATIQDLKDSAAAEAQQFAAAINDKNSQIDALTLSNSEKDARIADLESQLANAPTPQSLDEVKAAIEGIVP